jgi:hypothetical protein
MGVFGPLEMMTPSSNFHSSQKAIPLQFFEKSSIVSIVIVFGEISPSVANEKIVVGVARGKQGYSQSENGSTFSSAMFEAVSRTESKFLCANPSHED